MLKARGAEGLLGYQANKTDMESATGNNDSGQAASQPRSTQVESGERGNHGLGKTMRCSLPTSRDGKLNEDDDRAFVCVQ